MKTVYELINSRSEPGIFIFNLKRHVTFANEIAWNIVAQWNRSKQSNDPALSLKIPPEIMHVCDELKKRLTAFPGNSCPEAVYLKKAVSIADSLFVLRGLIISCEENAASTRFLIHLERLAARGNGDLDVARDHYHLSQREFQICQLLLCGLTNKEIGGQLNLSEPTVKGYMQRIMGKVEATTRSGVVSKILTASVADFHYSHGADGMPSPQQPETMAAAGRQPPPPKSVAGMSAKSK